jgi:hypothetical protein
VQRTPHRWEAVARTWTGILAAVFLLISSTWLLENYIHAKIVYPAEKALVESLKEKAKNDAEIQKTLQPELDRQLKEVVARRHAYDRGGIILLISAAAMIAWLGWLRPRRGCGAGAPSKILRFVEKPPDPGKKKPERIQRIQKIPSGDSGPVE